jgi:hypothetical protein
MYRCRDKIYYGFVDSLLYTVVDIASTVTRQMDFVFLTRFRENHPRFV